MRRLSIALLLTAGLIGYALMWRLTNNSEPTPAEQPGPRYCLVHRQAVAFPLPPFIHCSP